MKKKIIVIVLAAAIVLTAVFFLYARSLQTLLTGSRNAKNIEITIGKIFDVSGDPSSITLTAEDVEDLLDELEDTAVRRVMFPKKTFHSTTVLSICAMQKDNVVGHMDGYYYPTERIISIDGKQYAFYGDDFIEELEEIYSKFLRENLSPA